MCHIKLALLLLTAPVAVQAQVLGDSTKTIMMEEVRVLTDKEKYSRDSAFAAAAYHKVFDDVDRKITRDPNVGVGTVGIQFGGLVSRFAEIVSGKRKHDKKFVKDFKQLQSEKYIALRYNPDVVARMTGLTGDTAAHFINANPMEEAFARQASELELKMWIRTRYRLWANRQD
jgi:hypothetical protein